MELKEYAKLLWRRSWVIVSITLLSAAVAFLLSQRITPTYEASTTLLIHQVPASGVTGYSSLFTSDNLSQTVAHILHERPVLQAVIANLKLNTSPEALATHVTVVLVRDTQLTQLIVDDPDPERAANIANEIIKVFSEQNRELQASSYTVVEQNLEQELAKGQADLLLTQGSLDALGTPTTAEQMAEQARLQLLLAQHRSTYDFQLQNLQKVQLGQAQSSDMINVVEAALPPTTPVRPNSVLYTLLAAIIGAMLALGGVFLVEFNHDPVTSSDQVMRLTGLPVLGAIARLNGSGQSHKLITSLVGRSPIAETYRMLGARIEFSALEQSVRTILVTSGSSREGKSTTIANLGIAVAQTGKRVILVDTDLRQPQLHHFFQQPNLRGVTNALQQPKEDGVSKYLMATGVNNLLLMPSGPLPANPAELFGPQRMTRLIEKLQAEGDLVLFDSPPLLGFADATMLAHVCDATLLVVLAESTRASTLKRAKEQLSESGARLLAVVLNRVSSQQAGYDRAYEDGQGNWQKRYRERLHDLRLQFLNSGNGNGSNGSGEAARTTDHDKTLNDS